MKEFMGHVTRWPLLLGAVICLTLGIGLTVDAGDRRAAMVILIVLGALLLGAWLWALATHTNPQPRDEVKPMKEENPDA